MDWGNIVDGSESEVDAAAGSWVREEIGINQVLGLFDTPAFARRGQQLEQAIAGLDDRCRRERAQRLKPVGSALLAWSSAVSGPGAWEASGFAGPVDPLWEACELAPAWAAREAHGSRRRAAADALAGAVRDFNARWPAVLESLGLDAVNALIDGYNRFYLLEKECVVGSPRLAARLYRPMPPISLGDLLARFPLLPDPRG